MGILIYLLILFQITRCSFIGAKPKDVKVSMTHIILQDHLVVTPNNVIKTIWQQEPAKACNIEKPPENMLIDKQYLQFNFVPYLCVILFDASLRYLELNSSHNSDFTNSGIAQEIIKDFSPDTFCQKMKDNKWFTTVEENKVWVSNFSNDMQKKYICQRYCVSEIVNPICAYTLLLDLSIKKMKHESQLPSSQLNNVQESQPLQTFLTPPKKEEVSSFVAEHAQVAHKSIAESASPNVNMGTRRQSPSVTEERQISSADTTGHMSLAHHSAIEESPVTSVQRQYVMKPYPYQTTNEDPARGSMPAANIHESSELFKTDKAHVTSNEAALSAHENKPDVKKNSGSPEYPVHSSVVQGANLSQDPSQVHPYVDTKPEMTDSNKQDVMKSPKKGTVVKQSSEPAQLEHTKLSGITTSASPQQAAETNPKVSVKANAGSLPPESQGEDHIEGQKQVSGEHKTSANLIGYDSVHGGHSGASNVVSPGDSPKSSVPETPKIPVPSGDKTEQVRVNTTVPENDTKEAHGSDHGETTEMKPASDQIGKSEPEAANQAIEGDGKVISDHEEPDDHEEQNAMDDVAVDSQVENGDALGDHGGDQAADRDEGAIDTMDQELPTETHRYNVGDNEEPSRADGSTKLSNNNNNNNNNNKDYLGGSDEDESQWSLAEQARNPINDAEGGYAHDRFVDAEDSHFFAYFMTMIVLCIIGYLIFHNKQKILALALEGRARKGTRRRPSTSGYRKLDSNLEEAVTSSCTGSSVTHVIY